ncbi:MAG: hypothetical protein EA397_12465 [Deltaproteobacteria bacterium]|nr:MAG: hypothetical protein EA397_12465 [Deltaproteobacteria bacterium]
MSGTLLIGDVHGCADELSELLQHVQPHRVILLGDLFSRGPDPVGVWSLIEAWEAEAVLGNHDVDVLKGRKPAKKLPPEAIAWLGERPLWIEDRDWIAVHAGIHPKGLKKTPKRLATGQRTLKGTPWYKRYRGDKLVVHGHAAARTVRDRRPYTLGLDTGCVRGGTLTGWIPEKNRIVTVPALRDWTR